MRAGRSSWRKWRIGRLGKKTYFLRSQLMLLLQDELTRKKVIYFLSIWRQIFKAIIICMQKISTSARPSYLCLQRKHIFWWLFTVNSCPVCMFRNSPAFVNAAHQNTEQVRPSVADRFELLIYLRWSNPVICNWKFIEASRIWSQTIRVVSKIADR